MDLDSVRQIADRVRNEVGKVIVGQSDALDLLLIALFSGGHILLEGPPGAAKTLLARAFAGSLGLQFGRIQFTPDLMPADIIGTNLFNFQTSSFTFTKGPVFCDLLLADEINRTPPKTQAALLEAMQERTVTLDGDTNRLSERFLVVATQNPIEQQGTYPLPEAQLDRFLFKHILKYTSEEEERRIVAAQGSRLGMPDLAALGVGVVTDERGITEAVDAIAGVRCEEAIVNYIVAIVRATRADAGISYGASPRSAAMLATASRARAALDGRDYVLPDDVKALSLPALRHRVVRSPAAEIDGRRVDDIISAIVERVEAPR